jgi:ATP-dependent Clp protease ATP-binding subunit ClpA
VVDVSPKRRPAAGRGTEPRARGRETKATLKLSGPTVGDTGATATRRGPAWGTMFLGAGGCRWPAHAILAGLLELFSNRARQVVVEAGETARALGHGFIGAEHLLLGVIAEKQGVGAGVLESLGVTGEAVRGELLLRHPQDDGPSDGALPFNEEGKKALERSLVEAKNLGDSRIQTEHVLLALLSTEPRSAANLLEYLGVRASRVRREVMRVATERRGWMAEVNQPAFGVWETLSPTGELRSVLAAAADLALQCDRSHIELTDVVFAICEDRNALALLTELGIQVERVPELLERHRSTRPPPAAGDSN